MYVYLLAVIILVILGMQFYRIKTMRFSEDQPNVVQEYVAANEAELKGAVLWISEPTATVFSNLKARELMYYPVFDLKKITDLRSRLSEAEVIFWDSRSLVCVPADDLSCQRAKEDLMTEIVQGFDAQILGKSKKDEIIYGIFTKR